MIVLSLKSRVATPAKQAGLNLIELMIAVTLGLMLIGAVMGVFLSSNRNYNQDERLARMQENGRYVMRRLSEELVMSTYWGGVTHVDNIDKSGVVFPAAQCNINFDPSVPLASIILSYDPTAFGACIPKHVTDTPIIVVKRVIGAKTTVQTPGVFYVVGTEASARLRVYNASDPESIPSIGESAREYIVRMYYIQSQNTAGVQVPTLYVRQMEPAGGGQNLTEYEIAEGIEAINIDFGIDSTVNGDGIPDRYTNTPSTAELIRAVTARLYVLTRTPVEDNSYTNTKTYIMGSSPVYTVNDKFRRRLFMNTSVMRNTVYMTALSI